MVFVGLQIQANLENIEELRTSHPDFMFNVKVKCTNCGEESGKWHGISESEIVESQNSRNQDGINFQMKCKMCGRENTIDIVKGSNGVYKAEDSDSFKTIVTFDCRGAEPTAFTPRSGWVAKASESNSLFENIDLTEGDWVDFDEKTKNSIGIYEFNSRFVKLKK